MYKNMGEFTSNGWELSLSGDIIRGRDLNWSSSLNLTHTKTRVATLYGNATYMNGGNTNQWIQWQHRIEEGVEVGSFWLYRHAGIQDGRFQIYDRNDKVIFADDGTQDDRVYMGNATPRIMAGWNHDIRWKNWSLNFTITSWLGYNLFRAIESEYGLKGAAQGNMFIDAITKNKDITGRPAPSSYFMYRADFLKLQNLTLGYTIPMNKWVKAIQSIDVYVTGNNLWRATKYPGTNPEIDINDWMWAGIDNKGRTMYPQQRMFTLGAKLNF